MRHPLLAIVFLLLIVVCVFLSVTLFRRANDTLDRVLSVAWPLNALALWLLAGGILSLSGGIASNLRVVQASFGFWMFVGGFLAVLSLLASVSSHPMLPTAAILLYAAMMLLALFLFQVFLSDEESKESKLEVFVSGLLAVFFVFLGAVVLTGLAVQNVSFATRLDEPLVRPIINGSELFVNCVGNSTTMILVIR